MSKANTLLLVDGSSYLFRAYHALPSLTISDGTPTGALYGVIKMLRKLIADEAHDRLAVVFDAPGKTFRSDLYAQYKQNRPPMPEDLAAQIAPLHAWVEAMGIPLLCEPGVEADDVMGTLACQAAAQQMHVTIVTGDKDLAQLVNEQVHLLDTMKNVRFDSDGVREKYGVSPSQIVDYLALMGDSVDNIPGIPGVGPKTAVKWLTQYRDLAGVKANADQVKGKIGERLREHLDQLELSQQLATIHCDVTLNHRLEDLLQQPADTPALAKLYERFEFRSWLNALQGGDESADSTASNTAAVEKAEYQTVLDQNVLDDWIQKLRAAGTFAFDTETSSLNYMRAEIVGVSFAIEPGEAAYVPLAHRYPNAPEQLDRQSVLTQLKPLLEDPAVQKIGQHLKYDWHVLQNHGIDLNGIAHDTMLQSYVLDSTASRHDMDSLANHYLGRKTIKFEEVAGKGAKQLTFDQVPIEKAAPYAAEDADITLQLHHHLWPMLQARKAQSVLYESVELPLANVLAKIEHCGVLVDVDQLRNQSQALAERLQTLEQEAVELAGRPVNLGSPKQLREVLFDELGLPVTKKTPTGQPSTDEGVLAELALDYPLPKLILEHRGLSKLKSTYTDKLPLMVNPDTQRIHTSYHQAVASTGRLSSSDPNLQNIPIRTEAGRRIRQAFIAPPGYCVVAADYSQIELRIMAHLSADDGLLGAFAAGQDVHRATAAELFSETPDAVSGDQRRFAKTINFALMYGMSVFGLARQLSISRPAAQTYMERYFERYPGVKGFLEQLRKQAVSDGYVETIFGRRLYLPDIQHRNHQRRQGAERAAINAPMQGSAADIIKRAMLAIDQWLVESDIKARMIMQVHDELVFEVEEAAVSALQAGVEQRMSSAADLSVALEVDIGVGENWDQAH